MPATVTTMIASMPRSGGNMLLSALRAGGALAGEWPSRLPPGAAVALVHLHYVAQVAHVPRRAVLLYRRNLLAQAVSWAVAYRTEDWTVGNPTPPIHLDTAEVVGLAAELRAARSNWLDWLSARSVPTLVVAYEDLVADPHVLARAAAWCGADPARAVPSTPRQASWVNEVWVEGTLVDLDELASGAAGPDGLWGRLARSKSSRGYVDERGRRLDHSL